MTVQERLEAINNYGEKVKFEKALQEIEREYEQNRMEVSLLSYSKRVNDLINTINSCLESGMVFKWNDYKMWVENCDNDRYLYYINLHTQVYHHEGITRVVGVEILKKRREEVYTLGISSKGTIYNNNWAGTKVENIDEEMFYLFIESFKKYEKYVYKTIDNKLKELGVA